MSERESRRNPCWVLVIVTAGGFVVASLAYVAAGFGDPAAPVNRFLNDFGMWIVCGLGLATVAAGVAALWIDRRHTLAEMSRSRNRMQSGESALPEFNENS